VLARELQAFASERGRETAKQLLARAENDDSLALSTSFSGVSPALPLEETAGPSVVDAMLATRARRSRGPYVAVALGGLLAVAIAFAWFGQGQTMPVKSAEVPKAAANAVTPPPSAVASALTPEVTPAPAANVVEKGKATVVHRSAPKPRPKPKEKAFGGSALDGHH
jgi:hypothetical protein